jgi:predicted DCC family thiol-disulfide oxidoreductase YuxK
MIIMSITLSANDRSGMLVYDQDCGICVTTAAWLASRVTPRRLGLLALSQVNLDPRVEALFEGRALATTLHFVRSDGEVLTGARAVLAAGRLVPGWKWLAIPFDNRVGYRLLGPVYREIAAHRRRIARALGLPAACAMPPRSREVA